MPEIGDQHHNTRNTANPFEETKPHISEYTAQEIATLSSRLEKQLGPEYISSRPGAAGQKVHYLAADKCINLANEVFGFNGWSSSIKQLQIDYVDESQSTGKVSLGLSVIVRVTLRNGTYHEDIGYGHIENAKGKAAAFEKAKKEGTTDALKRALRNFGNILGNCVYDKDYVAKVTKMKIAPSKWDPDNLHRHHDYAPVKKEETEQPINRTSHETSAVNRTSAPLDSTDVIRRHISYGEDEFGVDDFDEVDFNVGQHDDPDGIVLETATRSDRTFQLVSYAQLEPPGRQSRRPPEGPNLALQTPSRLPHHLNHPESQAVRPQLQTINSQTPNLLPAVSDEQVDSGPNHPQSLASPSTSAPVTHRNPAPNPSTDSIVPESSDSLPSNAPVGFFNAKAAESVQKGTINPREVPSFNVHGESPSIRKTAGVDHSRSKPVRSEAISAKVQGDGVGGTVKPSTNNFVNPQVDKMRRVGMPSAGGSPLSNRGTYRPPQMKRPIAPGRPPLADVTSGAANVVVEPTRDGKRQRTEEFRTFDGVVS